MYTKLIWELFIVLVSFLWCFLCSKTIMKFLSVLHASAWLARTRVGAYLSLHVEESLPRLKEDGNYELSSQERCSCHTEALTSAGGKEQKSSRCEAAPLSAFLLSQAHALWQRKKEKCWLEWVVKSRKTYVVVLNPAQDRRGGFVTQTEPSFLWKLAFLFSTGTVSLLLFKRGLPAGQTISMPHFFSCLINFAELACLCIVPAPRSNSAYW